MKLFRIALLLLPVSVGSTACYTYVPVESPTRGMEVRARLTQEAAVRYSQGLDEPILRFDGVVVGAAADSVALDVLIARSSSAFQDVTIRDTISLKRSDLQTIMLRKLSPARSAIFGVGLVVGGVAVVLGIDQVVGGTGGEDTDPGVPTLREPFFLRIPFSKLIGWLTQSQ